MTRIDKPKYFNVEQIANSGQCFRFLKVNETNDSVTYRTIYKSHYIEIKQFKNDSTILEISCSVDDWNSLWVYYFDLDSDYSKYEEVINSLDRCDYGYIKEAFEFSKGIRILRQDSFEMLISYIISQRNRIEKISKAVELISETFGTRMVDEYTGKRYFTFPDETQLPINKGEYNEIRLGYRDIYVANAVKEVQTHGINYYKDYNTVMSLYGVGDKVANCFLLFGCNEIKRFPIDVWIERIINNYFGGRLNITPFLQFSGIVQQYMFYYERNR